MKRRSLAGSDGPGRRALPAGEFLQPIPLLAVALLALNDWYLKSAAPSALTGKLSDVAGLVFFPLLLTALWDVALLGLFRLGLKVDFTLRRRKLAMAVLGTLALFSALKLSPDAAELFESLLGSARIRAQVVSDPTDLWALPALLVAVWLGLREIRRLPLGRLELAGALFRSRGISPAEVLADLPRCGADRRAVDELARALEAWLRTDNDAEKVALEHALAKVRVERP
jgi:hypothetical protein